jgi:DNA-binding IclR family transcriptional regulator
VLLAFAPEDVRQELLASGLRQRTPATITLRERLLKELDVIRDQRYAQDDEEFQEALRCVAMPVRDFSGGVVYAVAASGPVQRFHAGRTGEIIAALRSTVCAMEAALGYRASS